MFAHIQSGHHCASTQVLKRPLFNPMRRNTPFFHFRIFAFLNFTKFISRMDWKKQAPNFVLSFKVRFLVISLPSWTHSLSFLQSRPLPDALCMVIHLPVFVFMPLPVRLLALCSARRNKRCGSTSNKILSFGRVLFHLYRTCGGLQNDMHSEWGNLRLKHQGRTQNEKERTLDFLPCQLSHYKIKAYKVCSIWSSEQIEKKLYFFPCWT
jgi:hypothetical protein